MAFPQYRIPIERLKEDWARQIAWKHMRRRRPTVAPSKITDNSEPWIRNPSSVAEFWEIACKINETVAKWAPRQDSRPKIGAPERGHSDRCRAADILSGEASVNLNEAGE